YDGLPMQPVAPPSPDYVPGPEHPPSPDYVLGPEHPPSPIEIPFVPESEYPEYLVPSEDEAPMEDQPLPAVIHRKSIGIPRGLPSLLIYICFYFIINIQSHANKKNERLLVSFHFLQKKW
ncbi:hypothetical protein Tco_0380731, partial [Tanacetum coccineum]